MSKVNDIKNMKRQQKIITPTQALAKIVGEEKEEKAARKRVSFDLRTDLYKELKLQAIVQEKKMYTIIEEALETYFRENK